MFSHVIIGQFVPVESFLHRLDPRTKIIAAFLLMLLVFLTSNWYGMLLFVGFALFLMWLSHIPFYFLYRGLKPIFILVAFTFLLHLFMTKGGSVWLELGALSVHENGFYQGTFIAVRLISIVAITSLVTLTTSPMQLTDGLEQLLTPLKKVRLPAHEFALMISIALRFIPTFLQEAEKILKAQMARGVDLTSGPWKERIKALIPLLVPLFMSAFKRAEELALAMEARGYQGGEGRTKLRELVWSWRDTISLLSCIALGIVIIWLRMM
ncbi:cobalt ABC transporter permease [Alkalihalobacillus alcalophilus ATCC 27647 = CGMCC 1.3604]|uniref:Energy-coupling factor transporter transmembrane protein EcfT n=1 Tax=Alkalihalobacillus alcalophilus ATCC 27647 = CGMCC 1.3604 TaxID=1218173 RepID=A0A094XHP8_ALKAL|nr:energy-coupling factor transporter transmembrane component T [Alkalihalobacillus alcalophilus]KGA98285.1 cobalt ABC transporter permease [Alkalihalobacillus alcalophilus ATCC 27647 = CGMCC 1.3604]MED1561603.1 energy-coupling factor transporter transmembrane component T [Alkalihalobacillus alcalophilus]THG89881.1 cobalt ABC transporter permease [Alkalihalobacillus alcalophilus ATCC 27647 = CGMCC 1.3604]